MNETAFRYSQGDIKVEVKEGSEDRVKHIVNSLAEKLKTVELNIVENALLANLFFGCGLEVKDEDDN